MRYSFYYPPENKVLVARNAEFLENSLITQEASVSLEDLEIIQEEDMYPSIDTSLNHEDDDLEIDEPQIELPPNGKTVGSKWLFKKKTDIDGVVHTYKARLVANGYTQTPWIDYEETFSSVVDIRAIRILIAITAYYNYKICVKSYLERFFTMKDLGEAAYILGIKIYRDRSRRLIGLLQSAYIKKILKRYCMKNSKRGSIRMQEKLKLSKSQGASTPAELKRTQNVPYASAVGFIMYDVRCTRPDVVFAQNVTRRFQQNP
nr:retrotransposon protein, putative, Ty1-copia subclass [Tanacetum cinerariifolium]